MKTKVLLVAALAACAVGAGEVKSLKVLAIGNSFSVCTLKEMPQVAKAMGVKLDLASLYIGGCSLERHCACAADPADLSYDLGWSRDGVRKASWPELEACVKPTTRTHGKSKKPVPAKGAHVLEVLKAEKWDVVTIQQASHFSWQPATYHPFGDELVKHIRACAPGAEIVVQETWSYTPWDRRFKSWKIDQNEMYARLRAAYGDFAKGYGFRVIPTGAAVQLWRKRLPVVYAENGFGGDVCGSGKFEQVDGTWTPKGDVFHFNEDGHYLQALVWTAKLFGVDVTKCPYAPKRLAPEKAALMRRVAQEAVAENGR